MYLGCSRDRVQLLLCWGFFVVFFCGGGGGGPPIPLKVYIKTQKTVVPVKVCWFRTHINISCARMSKVQAIRPIHKNQERLPFRTSIPKDSNNIILSSPHLHIIYAYLSYISTGVLVSFHLISFLFKMKRQSTFHCSAPRNCIDLVCQ